MRPGSLFTKSADAPGYPLLTSGVGVTACETGIRGTAVALTPV
jgi:hypothetical protein